MKIAENRAEGDAPVGDDAKRIGALRTQGLQCRQDIRIEFPTGVFLKFLIDGLRQLIETPLIVFLDESRYERTDSKTKEKTIRERKSGEVIWHDKGEDAPVLVNLGKKPYRTLVIEVK